MTVLLLFTDDDTGRLVPCLRVAGGWDDDGQWWARYRPVVDVPTGQYL